MLQAVNLLGLLREELLEHMLKISQCIKLVDQMGARLQQQSQTRETSEPEQTEPEYVCQKCGKSYKNRSSINTHYHRTGHTRTAGADQMEGVLAVTGYLNCSICAHPCKNKIGLAMHKWKAHKIKSKTTIDRHRMSGSSVNPIICRFNCGVANFKFYADRTKHERKVHGRLFTEQA